MEMLGIFLYSRAITEPSFGAALANDLPAAALAIFVKEL
jgi:hypothetical protein